MEGLVLMMQVANMILDAFGLRGAFLTAIVSGLFLLLVGIGFRSMTSKG
jgi:hypothetical protein